MKALKSLFYFYVFSNIHVSLAVFSLTKITLLQYDIESDLLPWFTFFSTFLSYNFIRLYHYRNLQAWYKEFVDVHKVALILVSVLSATGSIFLMFHLKLKTLWYLFIFFLLTLFYAVPLNFNANAPVTFRSIAFMKLAVISICWAGVTVMVPLMEYEVSFSNDEIIMVLQRMLLVAAITIPFDIRDVYEDDSTLKTLPQAIGVKNSKITGTIFLLLFLALIFLLQPPVHPFLWSDLLIAGIAMVLLWMASAKQTKFYSAFLVESVPICWLLLVYIFLK